MNLPGDLLFGFTVGFVLTGCIAGIGLSLGEPNFFKRLFSGVKYLSMGPVTTIMDEGVRWHYASIRVESGPFWRRETSTRTIVRLGDGRWWDLDTTEDLPREPFATWEVQAKAKMALARSGKGFFDAP